MLTGSAVAILQISVRKVGADWSEPSHVTGLLRTRAVSRRLSGCSSAAPPLLQTKAWRAPRRAESVRQTAAARKPNSSARPASSSAFKAPISARRYCSSPYSLRLSVGCSHTPRPCLVPHEAASCQASRACVGIPGRLPITEPLHATECVMTA